MFISQLSSGSRHTLWLSLKLCSEQFSTKHIEETKYSYGSKYGIKRKAPLLPTTQSGNNGIDYIGRIHLIWLATRVLSQSSRTQNIWSVKEPWIHRVVLLWSSFYCSAAFPCNQHQVLPLGQVESATKAAVSLKVSVLQWHCIAIGYKILVVMSWYV